VKFLATALVLICGFAATAALADDVVPQPLTHADCERAHLKWDDNANVCTSAVDLAVTPASTGQPLTRRECGLAHMTWDDSANVCDVGSGRAARRADADAGAPEASTILIDIDKTKQKMVVSVDGVERYSWPVSTGRPGYSTPSGTYTPTSMNEIWYSKQWDNAPMPHAIFFTKQGHAIHGSYDVRHLGKPASHGCVRISPKNAATLYDLVAKNGLDHTEVVLAGLAPGSRVTSSSNNHRYDPTAPATLVAPADETVPQANQRRGGFFKRLFGRRQAQ
jgi:hypothetical protein